MEQNYKMTFSINSVCETKALVWSGNSVPAEAGKQISNRILFILNFKWNINSILK